MRATAEQWLAPHIAQQPEIEETTDYGDRIEIRRIWTHPVEAERIGLYDATQVYAIERQVIGKSRGVKDSQETGYAITNIPLLSDPHKNAEQLMKLYRGHWSVESKNHYRRDVTYGEDKSPIKNHNAARVLATLKMVAIFLCEIGAHNPKNDRERSLPEFNRSCAINGIDRAIGWLTRKKNPLKR